MLSILRGAPRPIPDFLLRGDRTTHAYAKNLLAPGTDAQVVAAPRRYRLPGHLIPARAVNGCSISGAEDLSWFGMSSAVRCRTPGAFALHPTPGDRLPGWDHHDCSTYVLRSTALPDRLGGRRRSSPIAGASHRAFRTSLADRVGGRHQRPRRHRCEQRRCSDPVHVWVRSAMPRADPGSARSGILWNRRILCAAQDLGVLRARRNRLGDGAWSRGVPHAGDLRPARLAACGRQRRRGAGHRRRSASPPTTGHRKPLRVWVTARLGNPDLTNWELTSSLNCAALPCSDVPW
jgi:hypothetical protein